MDIYKLDSYLSIICHESNSIIEHVFDDNSYSLHMYLWSYIGDHNRFERLLT